MIQKEQTKKLVVFYFALVLFLSLGFYYMLKKESYWFFALPLVLIVAYYYLVSLDKIVLLITFLTPLAVTLNDSSLGAALSVPSEPLMFGVLVLFLGNLILVGNYNRKVSTHIIAYLIYFNLFWMFVTSMTSALPLVSFKHLLSRIWFVVPFFFVASPMFRVKKNIHKFLWLYILSLTIVIIYTLIRHSGYGFDEQAGHWVMTPFYNDHTAYGAALSMFIPVLAGYIFFPKLSSWQRITSLFFFVLFAVALTFSYSRAAWLSTAVALFVFLLVMLRIRFRWVATGTVLILVLAFSFQQQIFSKLEKNKQDSSTSFVDHVKSMSNISSDPSNMERINRWASAIRMFEQRPLFGWGPGTYQFEYAPFQLASEMTQISTNLGDRGNAHSEYLGPLSEEGIPGLISVLLLVGFAIKTGLDIHKKGNTELKFLSLMVTLGIIAYFFHGLMNDFLATDKLSVPVWGFMAILVSLEVYHSKEVPAEVHQES
ncbi:MAG: O-antigen ligase family protein [Bacteroidales bacterium]|nr:O-antigen ligase family protein [Bacteroidales bacterium]